MENQLKDEIKNEEKNFKILLVAVLSPVLLGLIVFAVYFIQNMS